LKQRIHYHLSIESIDNSSWNKHVLRSHYDYNDQQRQLRGIQEKRTDSLIACIIQAEDNIREHKQAFDEEMEQQSGELTGKQIDLLFRRFKLIEKKLRYQYNLRIQSLLSQSYFNGVANETNNNSSSIAAAGVVATSTSYSPSMIIDTKTSHHLTDEQIQLLNRGPTYVPPCQIYVSSSSSNSSLNEQLQKQYKSFQHDLNILLNKFQVNTARSMFIHKEIKDTYMNLFSVPLSSATLHRRALYEKQLIDSIRKQMQIHDLILRRTADQSNTFYLGNRTLFEEKANKFMNTAVTTGDLFELCHTIDETNLQATQDYLMKINKEINAEFEVLFPNKKIHKNILDKIWIETATTSKSQLPYLYFLPDISITEVINFIRIQ